MQTSTKFPPRLFKIPIVITNPELVILLIFKWFIQSIIGRKPYCWQLANCPCVNTLRLYTKNCIKRAGFYAHNGHYKGIGLRLPMRRPI